MREGSRRQAGGRELLLWEGGDGRPGVGGMPVGRGSPRACSAPGESWARLWRAPRPVPTLLCAGLGLRGLSVDLLSRPPGWLGGNPWGKGAGQRVKNPPGQG